MIKWTSNIELLFPMHKKLESICAAFDLIFYQPGDINSLVPLAHISSGFVQNEMPVSSADIADYSKRMSAIASRFKQHLIGSDLPARVESLYNLTMSNIIERSDDFLDPGGNKLNPDNFK